MTEFRVIDEIKERFNHFLETGDDSRIPADLQSVIFRQVRDFVAFIDDDHN